MCLMPRTKTIPCGYSVIQASSGEELPAVEEVVADVVDRPLDLALRLGPVQTACADPEAPVAAEAQDSGFSTSRPPSARLSPVMTAFIWSNSSSDGTPPK